MEQEHQRCVRSGQTFCLAVLDIDHFKAVNDTLRPCRRRRGAARRGAGAAGARCALSDMLARWGGEEFVLLLSDTRPPLARGGLERLRERVARLRIAVPTAPLAVTLSAGLAEHHAGETVVQTLERADRALYEAKAQGRNRVALAESLH